MKRKAILEKRKATGEILKSASAHEKDHLSCFPQFHNYQTNGLSLHIKSGHGDKISSYMKRYVQNLLKRNMENVYGSEWQTEEKSKRQELVSPEARYLFVYESSSTDANRVSRLVEARSSYKGDTSDKEPIVGFVQYRFTIEEEIPVLYLYELQLEPHVQGMGLGKFLMQLIELIARENLVSCVVDIKFCHNRMRAVVLTVQKENVLAMNFYTDKLRYTISSISPSRVEHMIAVEQRYEILCKVFDQEAKAVLEVFVLQW